MSIDRTALEDSITRQSRQNKAEFFESSPSVKAQEFNSTATRELEITIFTCLRRGPRGVGHSTTCNSLGRSRLAYQDIFYQRIGESERQT